jgi:hypothetical protein
MTRVGSQRHRKKNLYWYYHNFEESKILFHDDGTLTHFICMYMYIF